MVRTLERSEEYRPNKKMTEWKTIGFRQRGGPKMRREDDVKRDLNIVKIYHIHLWEKLAKIRNE